MSGRRGTGGRGEKVVRRESDQVVPVCGTWLVPFIVCCIRNKGNYAHLCTLCRSTAVSGRSDGTVRLPSVNVGYTVYNERQH